MYLSEAFVQEFMFHSPFSYLSQSQERKLTYLLLFSLILLIVVLKYFDHFLVNSICENGIISFELAKDVDIAKSYMNSWGEQGRIAAGLSLGLDFLFPIVYSMFIALLIHKLNVRLWETTSFYKVGLIILWLQFVAAIFDYIENYGLIRLLLGDVKPIWASIAYYFAMSKFLLILVGIGYILINFGLFLIKKPQK